MIAGIMELKRLGMVNKPLMIVPNHLVQETAKAFYELYPNAKLLITNKDDFQKQNRRIFTGKITTGEYDCIIMAHSSFEKMPMSKEIEEQHINKQIYEILEAKNGIKGSRSIKQLESERKKLEKRLKVLLESKQRDDLINFEETGIDYLIVDEAHLFKNLYTKTKMNGIAGIQTSNSQRSSDLLMKTQFLLEKQNGKGIIFATGTPVSNSLVELYTMMKYLMPYILQKMGIYNFDEWASTFSEVVNSLELAPTGNGYRVKQRLAKFYNLPELMSIFRMVADIKVAKDLNLPVPKVKDGKPTIIALEPSEELKEYSMELAERASNVKNVKPDEDNMLKICSDGKKAALDLRLINEAVGETANLKVNAVVEKTFEIWENSKDEKLTQLIFCDLSTPNEKVFNVYSDIKNKLVKMGISEHEVAFIHDAKTDLQKANMFQKVRDGEIRVIIGSTNKMGAGTNIQDKLKVLHHLDVPWRPSDIEQRERKNNKAG